MSTKLRLHVESLRSKSPHMHITEAVYAAAAGRHPRLAERLEVTIGQDGERFDECMPDADILFGQGFPTERLARVAPRLRWISVASAGVENLMPLDWLPEQVVLTNNSGTHAPRAREYAMLMLLALHQRLPKTVTDQRAHRWAPSYSSMVAGKHVLVVGFGNIGQAVAEAAKQLGMRVTGIRRRAQAEPAAAADEVLGVEQLHSVLPEADYVVIATPLTEQTRGLFSAAVITSMKPGAGLINLGRGAVLDHEALRNALASGHLCGAVLDVFETEPLPESDTLWDTPNLIVTPHSSCDDPQHYIPRSLDLFFANLGRFIEDEQLENVVDRTLGY